MYPTKFIIFAERADGSIIRCFSWSRDAASGLSRAKADAKHHNVDCVRFWAEPVEETVTAND